MKILLQKVRSFLSIVFVAWFSITISHAQEYEIAQSPSLTCLTMVPDGPYTIEYPAELLKRRDGGKVVVDLVFDGPDSSPDVTFLDKSLFSDLIYAVRKHVARFRVPCMKVGDEPVRLRQEYVFTPHDGRKIVSSAPVDLAEEEVKKQLQCVDHVRPGTKPNYSVFAREKEAQGNYYVQLRFEHPDQAPVVKWLAAAKDSRLKAAVADYVEGLRMPCLKNAPITTTVLYRFVLDGGPRTFLKDTDLVSFLSNAKDMQQPVSFDFDRMACPFDLRIQYSRPYTPSRVSELENSHSERKKFVDWLSLVTLDLKESDNVNVLGSVFTLRVPCGSLKL